MKNLLILVLVGTFCAAGFAQGVSINENDEPPHASAILDVQAEDKGLLIPRMETDAREAISDPATGLVVFDIETQSYWYYLEDHWMELTSSLHGLRDVDGDTRVQVEESLDEDIIRLDIGGVEAVVVDESTAGATRIDVGPDPSLIIGHNAGLNTEPQWNVILGPEAGQNNTSGSSNVMVGYGAGRNNGVIGNRNVMLGYETGITNNGVGNTMVGYQSGRSNFDGNGNTYLGYESGMSNVSGWRNVAAGVAALHSATDAHRVVAVGDSALFANTASGIVAVGSMAGLSNTTGGFNTFVGSSAGRNNTDARGNTFVGSSAGRANTTGDYNVFIGWESANRNTEGEGNVFVGNTSGFRNTRGDNNVFIGRSAAQWNETGSDNIAVGRDALLQNTSGSLNIAVGIEALGDQFGGGGNGEGSEWSSNIGIGHRAGRNVTGGDNIIIGNNSGISMTGQSNILLGGNVNHRGNDNTYLGNNTGAHLLSTPTGATAVGYNTLITQDHSVILGRASNTAVRVGIGTMEPEMKLHIAGGGQDMLRVSNGGNDALVVEADRDVIIDHELLINTTTGKPGYQMSVDGRVACEEVLVQNSNDWPDYVFEKDYDLLPMPELKDYLEREKHLPGIPSAKEVDAEGFELGEMQRRLLEKVEELTLYILELEERLAKVEN